MKQEIIKLLCSTDREGIQNLINYIMNETDFFTAPASTRFHGSYEGGLAEHSLNVYYELLHIVTMNEKINISKDSIIICCLLHDICKANFYVIDYKNVKVGEENKVGYTKNIWEQQAYYKVDDKFPIGHSEKSIIMIQKYIKLTDQEIMLIRWHMGGFDETSNKYLFSNACELYPEIIAMHIADMTATYLVESRGDK